MCTMHYVTLLSRKPMQLYNISKRIMDDIVFVILIFQKVLTQLKIYIYIFSKVLVGVGTSIK